MVRGGEISTKHKFKQSVGSKDNNGSDDSDEDYVVSDEENEVSACSEEEEYCSSLDGYPSEASDRFVERKVRTKAKKVNNRSKKKKKLPKRHCVSFKDEEEDEDDDDVDDKDYDENEDEEEEFTKGKLKARGGFSSARKNGVKISQKRRRAGHKEVDENEDDDDDEDEDEDKDYDEDEEFAERNLKVRGGFSSARKNGVKISQKRRRVGHKEEDEDENEVDDVEDEDDDEDYDEDEEFTVGKSKARGGFSSVEKNGVKPSPKRRIVRHEEEEEDDDEEFTPSINEDDENEDEDEEITEEGKSISRGGLSSVEKNGVKPSQKRRVGHEEEDDDEEFTPSNNEDEEEEEEEDDDNDDEDEEDDEDFTAEEDESLDEELPRVKRKKKTYRKSSKRVSHKTSARGRKRRKRSMASKKPKPPKRKKSRKAPRGSRRKSRSDDEEEEERLVSSREQGEELKRGPKRRRFVVDSDSDFAPSARYDDNYDYTISEEEREQVREAREFCRSKAMPEKVEAALQVERKPKGRKGKEKVVEEEEKRPEAAKRVCGICLSEEDKRRVRGTINCCEHYFCFTCIMEWAKVESRCPLCKQRFNKIIKRARSSSAVVGPIMATVDVPERDQVYQPTEEELRSYLYPYEDVICSECHLGGHDHLMLLCDECDSSAHTFCVGLGHEVPEGSWFCRDCKPLEPESPNSHSQTHSLSCDERPPSNDAPPPTNTTTGFEGFDLNSVSPAPGLPSPRNQFGGFQATTTALAGAGAGAGGASTVSGRIRLRHQIHHCLSERPDRPEAANQRESSEFFEERFRENHSTRARETDSLSPDLSNPTTDSSGFVNGGVALWPRLEERDSLPDHEQRLRQCNGGRQEVDFHAAKEQLQLMVKAHLKNLSRGSDLGQSKLEEIAKCSTRTILVACELELRNNNEVALVTVSQPPTCDHIELVAVSKPSLVRGCCSSCFDSFVVDIVKRILEAKLSEERRWLCLGLSL